MVLDVLGKTWAGGGPAWRAEDFRLVGICPGPKPADRNPWAQSLRLGATHGGKLDEHPTGVLPDEIA